MLDIVDIKKTCCVILLREILLQTKAKARNERNKVILDGIPFRKQSHKSSKISEFFLTYLDNFFHGSIYSDLLKVSFPTKEMNDPVR